MEVNLIADIFKRYGKQNGTYLDMPQFKALFEQKYIHNSNLKELGKQTLKKVKKLLKNKNITEVLKPFDKEKSGSLSQRNFKVGMYQEFQMSQGEVEILIEYLDTDCSGYFSLEKLNSELITA